MAGVRHGNPAPLPPGRACPVRAGACEVLSASALCRPLAWDCRPSPGRLGQLRWGSGEGAPFKVEIPGPGELGPTGRAGAPSAAVPSHAGSSLQPPLPVVVGCGWGFVCPPRELGQAGEGRPSPCGSCPGHPLSLDRATGGGWDRQAGTDASEGPSGSCGRTLPEEPRAPWDWPPASTTLKAGGVYTHETQWDLRRSRGPLRTPPPPPRSLCCYVT